MRPIPRAHKQIRTQILNLRKLRFYNIHKKIILLLIKFTEFWLTKINLSNNEKYDKNQNFNRVE